MRLESIFGAEVPPDSDFADTSAVVSTTSIHVSLILFQRLMMASRIQKWKWVSTIITSLSVLRFMLTHSKVTFMHKTYTASDALT